MQSEYVYTYTKRERNRQQYKQVLVLILNLNPHVFKSIKGNQYLCYVENVEN